MPRTSRINVGPELALLSSLFFSLLTHFLPPFSHSFSLSTFPPSCLFFPSNFIFPFSISFVMSYDPGSHLRKYLAPSTFILASVKGRRYHTSPQIIYLSLTWLFTFHSRFGPRTNAHGQDLYSRISFPWHRMMAGWR